MAAPELEDEPCLSESVRYWPDLVAAAKRLLALKGETRLVRGGRRGMPCSTKTLTTHAESQDQRHQKSWLGLLERHERCAELPSENSGDGEAPASGGHQP
jgi:hypothetical protein